MRWTRGRLRCKSESHVAPVSGEFLEAYIRTWVFWSHGSITWKLSLPLTITAENWPSNTTHPGGEGSESMASQSQHSLAWEFFYALQDVSRVPGFCPQILVVATPSYSVAKQNAFRHPQTPAGEQGTPCWKPVATECCVLLHFPPRVPVTIFFISLFLFLC